MGAVTGVDSYSGESVDREIAGEAVLVAMRRSQELKVVVQWDRQQNPSY